MYKGCGLKLSDWFVQRNKRVSPFCICLTVYAWMNVTGLRGTLRGSLRGRMRGG